MTDHDKLLTLPTPTPLGFRIIGAFKTFIAILLVAASFGIFHLMDKDTGVMLEAIVLKLHLDPENRLINLISEHVLGINHRRMEEFGIGTLCYALLYGVEGIGIFFGRHWAEYLIIGTTAFFVPVEIYEIIHKMGPIKLTVFLINMIILVYFIRQLRNESKRRKDIEQKALAHVINSPEQVTTPPSP